jgi:hypothetical protein
MNTPLSDSTGNATPTAGASLFRLRGVSGAGGAWLSLLFLSLVAPAAYGQGTCGLDVTVQSQTRSATRGKCTAIPSYTTPVKYFLKRQYNNTTTYSYTYAGYTQTYSLQTESTLTLATSGCADTTVCGGSASYTDTYDPNANCTATLQSDCSQWNNGACWDLISRAITDIEPYASSQTTDTETTRTTVQTYYFQQGGIVYDFDSTETWTLSNEFTDDLLRTLIIGDLGAFSAWSDGGASASYALDQSHVNGTGVQVHYRLKLRGGEAGVTYKLRWQEVTVCQDGSSTARTIEEYLTASGPECYSSVHTMDPPSWCGTAGEGGQTSTTVENIAPPEVVDTGAGGGGGGSGGGGGGGGDHPAPGTGGTCGSDGGQGGGQVVCVRAPCSPTQDPCKGVSATLSLGSANYGTAAGNLYLSSELPSLNLATPNALAFSGSRAEVEVVAPTGVVRQVKAPQALADIVTINDFKYEARFYYLGDVGSKQGDTYQILNPNNWFVKWTVENPDASTNAYNRLRLTETRGASTKVSEYAYDAGTAAWTLSQPGSLREDHWEITQDLANQNRTYTSHVRPPGGNDVLKRSRTFHRFDWGEGVVAESAGDGASLRTTSRAYYLTAGDAGFAPNGTRLPLRCVIPPDGAWQRYDSYDTAGRPLVVVSQFLNASTNALESNCRAVHYDYTPLANSGDDGSLQPQAPRTTIEYLLGQEIGRTYAVIKPGEKRSIRCQTAGAAWTAADNLVTITRYYTTGSFTDYARSTDYPDGTRTAWLYSTSGTGTNATQTTVVLNGQVDPNSDTNILAGTITTAALGHVGQLISTTVQDKASTTILNQDNYTYLDEFRRSYTVAHLDATTETYQYACCGLDTTTDRDGVQSQYLYDDMGRQLGRTILAYTPTLTTTNILNAAGNVLATVRNAGGSVITNRQAQYDLAGVVTAETNALFGATTFVESTDGQGQRVRTSTYPDSGTRIETYYQDGQLAKVTGTALSPVRYAYGIEQDSGIWRAYTTEIKLDANGNDTSEWAKTYSDLLGRSYKTLYAAPGASPYRQSFFNTAGQLWKERDPDNLITLYGYNAKGEQVYRVVDSNRNGTIDFAGMDRITWTTNDVTTYSGYDVRRTRTIVYTNDNSTATVTNAMTQTTTTGLKTWQTVYRDSATPVTTLTETAYGANGARTVTTTAPDGSSVVRAYSYGRLQSVTRKDSGGSQVGQSTYTYDAHGRQATATDARNGPTTYGYNNANQGTSVTAPNLGTGEAPQVTTTFFDTLGRAVGQQLPDGTTTTNLYFPTGLLQKTWGSRIYPVEYTYDAQGRMRTMKTWQSFAGNAGTATTRWNYDGYRGWLASKDYPDPSTGQPQPKKAPAVPRTPTPTPAG